uniref:Uncharacterized protein n=1 Tax=Solanum tuberosum TaxID=4113 RepID=M1DYG3_SOLTU
MIGSMIGSSLLVHNVIIGCWSLRGLVDIRRNDARKLAPMEEPSSKIVARGGNRGKEETKETLPPPRERVEEEVEIQIEDDVQPEVEAHGMGTFLRLMTFEVVQQVLAFLSGLACMGATSTVQTTQVQINFSIATMVPNIDKASGYGVFFHLLLGTVMTGIEHEM